METVSGSYCPGYINYHRPGGPKVHRVDITWKLEHRPLEDGGAPQWVFTACGNVWKKGNNDVWMAGQCLEQILSWFPDDKKVRRIVEVWRRWHLNDMHAGCEHQRAAGWENNTREVTLPNGAKYRANWVRPSEHPDGLLCKPCEVCGYEYGTKWLFEPIPIGILTEIRSW